MWKKGKFQLQKVPMGVSEKNETKAMHRLTLRVSNSANDKVFRLFCCYDNSDVSNKMAEN